MRVKTPAMKLDLRIDEVELKDGQLLLTGMAGMLPCETTMTAREVRALLRRALRPSILWWALRSASGADGTKPS